MQFQVEIEYWEGVNGICPIADQIEGLPNQHQVWIIKRDVFFESLTFEQLKKSGYFPKAQGTKYPLGELRYVGSKGYNYRMLCIIWKDQLVGLVLFQGSGSGGQLRKHIKQAIELAEDWKKRHP
jgi:hypothetical protein